MSVVDAWVLYYQSNLTDQDLRAAFAILLGQADRVGGLLYEATDDATLMTPEYVEQTIRETLRI